MNHLILASFASSVFGLLLSLMAVFLILLVLVQRGRGGGLAGALGGMGGSSAFGAKAGDVFTRITIVAAAIWIILCIAAAKWGSAGQSRINVTTRTGGAATATADPGKAGEGKSESVDAAPAGKTDSKSDAAPASKSDAAPPAEPSSTAPAATPPASSTEPAGNAPADATPAAPQ